MAFQKHLKKLYKKLKNLEYLYEIPGFGTFIKLHFIYKNNNKLQNVN